MISLSRRVAERAHPAKFIGHTNVTFVAGILLMAVSAMAAPITVAWDAPTRVVTGEAIPAELAPDLRYHVWSRPLGSTNWWTWRAQTGDTQATIDLPVGAHLLAVTAQFRDVDYTRSNMSSGLTHRAFARVVEVGGVRVID